jgi:hypothetical protein
LEVSVKILAVVIPVKGVWSLNSPKAPAPRAWTTLSGWVSGGYGSRECATYDPLMVEVAYLLSVMEVYSISARYTVEV